MVLSGIEKSIELCENARVSVFKSIARTALLRDDADIAKSSCGSGKSY
jgi:hypothetical protein